MSANVDVLRRSDLIGSTAREKPLSQVEIFSGTTEWDPEDFAREQIRGLVRRVFFVNNGRAVRQVVFSGADRNPSVSSICDQVGQALALETSADIAIVGSEPEEQDSQPRAGRGAIKSRSTLMAVNLWRVPAFAGSESEKGSRSCRYWLSCLAALRNEFEYSIIHGPAAGTTSEAALLGELADGIILVVGANRTRRAAARNIKETLQASRSRILGTVLSERTFPIPERIYRRL